MSTIYPFKAKKSNPSVSRSRSVTGRDGYILAQALFCFIATEQAKPDDEQEWSNLQDAIAIFNARVGAVNAGFFADRFPDQVVSLTDEKAPRHCPE